MRTSSNFYMSFITMYHSYAKFGFMHALSLSKEYKIEFDAIYFLHTGLGGWVFAWLAYKSKSLVKPIVSHGVTNCLAALASMIN